MIVDENTWDSLSNYRDSLEHYNRKGSKWYTHRFGRFQEHAKYAVGVSNPDKKESSSKESWRDRREAASKKRAEEKAAKDKAKAEKKEAEAKIKAEKEAAKKEKQRQDILKSPSQLYKHRYEYSYEEIQKAMATFKWEKELRGYSENTLKKGADFIKDITSIANNSINAYNTAARIVNSLYTDNGKNVMPFIGGIESDKNKKKDKKNNSNA